MKTKKESISPAVRNKYKAQFKEQALERAERDGIPKVAQDLGGYRVNALFMAIKTLTDRSAF